MNQPAPHTSVRTPGPPPTDAVPDRTDPQQIGPPHFPVTGSEVAPEPTAAHGLPVTATPPAAARTPSLVAGIWSVCSWELRTFFLRPTSYFLLLGAVLAATWGFSWLVTLLSNAADPVRRLADEPIAQFLGPNLWLIGTCSVLVPLLTMNSIAEERRRGTWEPLLTVPMSPGAIVLGKFGAVWSLLLICLSPWVYFALVLRVWNGRLGTWHGIPWLDGPGLPFDLGPVVGACVGLAVVGATLVALGLFCSGFSRTPSGAAILTLGVLGIVLLTALAPRVLISWGFGMRQAELVELVSCWGHLARFSRGTIEPALVAGHITVCSLLLAGTAATCRRADGG